MYYRYATIYNASIGTAQYVRHKYVQYTPTCLGVRTQSPGNVLTYLLTYVLTPWSRVLLEKLTGLQLVKKFPTFYVARRFITAFTSARHLSLF